MPALGTAVVLCQALSLEGGQLQVEDEPRFQPVARSELVGTGNHH